MIRYALALLALTALPAQALDYRSVAGNAAILFDAPSTQAKRMFVLGRGYPVEVVVSVDNWLKVRDHTGALAWVERASLADKRMVMVTAALAEIRTAAQDNAAISARADKGVLLEWQETVPGGWVKVRLPGNASGYVKSSQVWGA